MYPATLQEQFDEFLANLTKRGKSPESIRSYGNTYRLFIAEGNLLLDDATAENFLRRYSNPATKNKVIGHFRSFSAYMAKQYPSVNIPTVGVVTLEQSKLNLTLPIVVEDVDATSFMAALSGNYLAWSFMTLIKNTGLRFSEAYNLTQANYYSPTASIHAIKFRGKGSAERQVALNLAAYLAFTVWVTATDKPSPYALRYAFHKAIKQCGIKVLPHWLRHTVATKLRTNGNSYDDIADLLGNTVEVCRQRYARMDHNKLDRMVNGL